ncbi:MAG: VacB/RNase II family 3'-5' exoribonuclease [Rhodobacteraceae bacterium]|nr:VacB/RNase II family 3'-5' exoribonuclease [Paracoccaceae bacterium]
MTGLPSRDALRRWISENPTLAGRRDVARAFNIKGSARRQLVAMLKAMEQDLPLETRKPRRQAERLAPVMVLRITHIKANGDAIAQPAPEWRRGDALTFTLDSQRRGLGHAPGSSVPRGLAPGDRVLARVPPDISSDAPRRAQLIRRIGSADEDKAPLFGIFHARPQGGVVIPVDKATRIHWHIDADAQGNAEDGELVQIAPLRSRTRGAQARIIARLETADAPKALSIFAIHQHGMAQRFSTEAQAMAQAMAQTTAQAAVQVGPLAPADGREDLSHLPFITIDPEDARDHDDACFAHADTDPKNSGGYVVWVAIADVAHYVRPGSALDTEARARGNSTYFPDRVLPMLPEQLSADLCSLRAGALRPCIAVRLQLDAKGRKISHRFVRARMRSVAALTYEEVQAAFEGNPSPRCASLLPKTIAPLFAAWHAVQRARRERQPLNIDLPERHIALNAEGEVVAIGPRPRLDSHRLIEEFMILANVAAAQTLMEAQIPLPFRVHAQPAAENLLSLRNTALAAGFALGGGTSPRTSDLNALMEAAADTPCAELIHIATLRAMPRACYHTANLGHFGLALPVYAHFTSPIRRYADLLVHRALITAHTWGDDGLSPDDLAQMAQTAADISACERRTALAERDTMDRYVAQWLGSCAQSEFAGWISGVARFGIFVRLEGLGADGLVPMRLLGGAPFRYHRDSQTLRAARGGRVLAVGQRVVVRLKETTAITGAIVLELCRIEGGRTGTGHASPPRARAATHRK